MVQIHRFDRYDPMEYVLIFYLLQIEILYFSSFVGSKVGCSVGSIVGSVVGLFVGPIIG